MEEEGEKKDKKKPEKKGLEMEEETNPVAKKKTKN